MLFIGIFTSEKTKIEILEIWRSSEINHSRYPSLHMFLQFTFLGFKMLISNSAIKRARWSTGNEKKRNLYICIFEPRATRNTCCSRSGKSWSKLSLRQFSRRTMVHGVKFADRVFHTRPKGAHTHTHTRAYSETYRITPSAPIAVTPLR